jgi:hypothetical protein
VDLGGAGQPGDRPPILTLAARARGGGFEAQVREIAERGLASDDDPLKAVRNLVEMLNRYLGDWETASYFLGLLAFSAAETDDAISYDLVENEVDRENLRSVVARLSGLYGREIRVGYDLSNRDPDDWQYIDVRSLYELDAAEWTIQVTLHHFNQRVSKLSGPPISILRLVNRLLNQLSLLESTTGETFTSMLDDEAIDSFVGLAQGLADRLRAGEAAAEAAATAPDPGP